MYKETALDSPEQKIIARMARALRGMERLRYDFTEQGDKGEESCPPCPSFKGKTALSEKYCYANPD